MAEMVESQAIPTRQHFTVCPEEEKARRSADGRFAGESGRMMMAGAGRMFMAKAGRMQRTGNMIFRNSHLSLAEIAPAKPIIPTPDGSCIARIVINEVARLRRYRRNAPACNQDHRDTEQREKRGFCFHLAALHA